MIYLPASTIGKNHITNRRGSSILLTVQFPWPIQPGPNQPTPRISLSKFPGSARKDPTPPLIAKRSSVLRGRKNPMGRNMGEHHKRVFRFCCIWEGEERTRKKHKRSFRSLNVHCDRYHLDTFHCGEVVICRAWKRTNYGKTKMIFQTLPRTIR